MRLHVHINDKLGELFKKRVHLVYGDRRGALSHAIEEAIILWLLHTDYIVKLQKVKRYEPSNSKD